MTTSCNSESNTVSLYLAMELSNGTWKLAFSPGRGRRPRLRNVSARNLYGLECGIKRAKARFGLPEDARVVCCYEAGRDGFWIHRFLLSQGIENVVVDSSSIEVNRRKRTGRGDAVPATQLAC